MEMPAASDVPSDLHEKVATMTLSTECRRSASSNRSHKCGLNAKHPIMRRVSTCRARKGKMLTEENAPFSCLFIAEVSRHLSDHYFPLRILPRRQPECFCFVPNGNWHVDSSLHGRRLRFFLPDCTRCLANILRSPGLWCSPLSELLLPSSARAKKRVSSTRSRAHIFDLR